MQEKADDLKEVVVRNLQEADAVRIYFEIVFVLLERLIIVGKSEIATAEGFAQRGEYKYPGSSSRQLPDKRFLCGSWRQSWQRRCIRCPLLHSACYLFRSLSRVHSFDRNGGRWHTGRTRRSWQMREQVNFISHMQGLQK